MSIHYMKNRKFHPNQTFHKCSGSNIPQLPLNLYTFTKTYKNNYATILTVLFFISLIIVILNKIMYSSYENAFMSNYNYFFNYEI